jgi:C1A family cysteine protease
MFCKTTHKGTCPAWTVLLLASLVLLAGWVFGKPAPGISQERIPVVSPVNPAFLGQTSRLKAENVRQMLTADGPLTPEGRRLGYKASPVNLSHLKELSEDSAVIRGRQRLGLPVSYDLRSTGKLTPVKDQGNCGSCWAFATYGSLESNLLPGELTDISENHLKNTHGFDWDYCLDGGNAYISAAYLGRWSGPVDEGDDPYNPFSGVSPPGLLPTKHIQEILIIPDRSNSSDNTGIKKAVMSYGAVYTSMYWGGSYNGTTHAYYFNGSTYSNHAVAIVGWDDNYSRSNFAVSPAGDGAFIVRNSWGTAWGEHGYFYVSYHDSNIGTENFIFYGAESTTNYSHIYQYDPLGWVTSAGYGKTTAWFANVFPAEADEYLSAVSFYTASPNSKFTLYIYKDVNITSGPRSGTLAGTLKGTIASAGYHTLSTGSPIFLPSGQRFSIVVKLKTPKYDYPIPIEYPMDNYSSLATANSGESFVSSNGTDWSDLTDAYFDSNVCLKAFTMSISETASIPVYLSGPANGTTGTAYTYTVGGSMSNVDHPVQYFVEWGDGTDSGWLPAGTTLVDKAWNAVETYPVSVKARCVVDTDIESDWSEVLNVIISDNPYPAVTLLSPTTDPAIPAGSIYRIQWDAPPDASTFSVLYSQNNGKSWATVQTGIASKYYDWTVPTPSKNLTTCLIKVIGYDGSVKVGEDRSSYPFAIEGVRLTSPNGGETLVPGETKTISWVTNGTKSPVASVQLYYSENNGSSWKLIEELQSNLGSYSWTVPSVSEAKTNCKVKVILKSASGSMVGSDISDGAFAIDPNP